MSNLALAVQKVELIGGESWFEHNSVALAAITAALLAAMVAILNRRAELRHDREMRNRDHIREIVDSSYQEVGQAIKKISDLMGVVLGIEEWRKEAGTEWVENPALVQELDRELEAARDQAHSTLPNLLTTNSRLEMRLGKEHPVATTHDEVRLAIKAVYDHAPISFKSTREQDAKEIDERLKDAAGSAYAEFREACFKWIDG
jgi:hypothetical protein